MKAKLVYRFLAALTTAFTVISATEASAITISNASQYYQQLGSKSGLSYETWSKFNGFVNRERLRLSDAELTPLNPADLTWQAGVNNVEVFFINEGASYHNRLLYSTNGGTDLKTVFADASSNFSILPNGGPLSLGEGINLGSFAGNTTLGFFLQNPFGKVFGADATQNPDRIQHMNVFQSDGYLILAYEDILGGGDRDYNDVVVAVKGLADTDDSSAAVPEPTSILGLVGLGIWGLTRIRRHQAVAP